MVPPALPPPLPGKKKSNFWPVIAAVMGFVTLAALAVGAVTTFQAVKKKGAAAQAAFHDMEKAAAEEREKMADSIEKGETSGSDKSIGRMKDQLEKSAAHLSGGDAAAARALAAYLSKMQEQAHSYEIALNQMLEANVLSFQFSERATLEAHRKLVVQFSAANDRLTNLVQRSEEMVRAELVAAKVPAKLLESTMNGFNQGRPQRALQLRIRQHDHTLGEAGLAVLDLLDRNWGRWERDEASGQLRFHDDATLATFNTLITQIQTAAEEQTRAQQELAAKMRAMNQP